MKYGSKITYFFLLIACCNSSFGMMRMFTRKQTPPRQYQQLSPQQQRMIQTKASSAAKTTPSFYNRMEQAVRNAWTSLSRSFYQTPAMTTPQSIIPQQSTQQLSVPINTQADQLGLATTDSHTSELQAFESALTEITQNREKLNLNNQQETNTILCTAPGNEELAWLLNIKSSEDMESYFTQQRIKILSPYLTPAEIDAYLSTIKQNKENVIEKNYTQPLPEKLRTALDSITGSTHLSPPIQEASTQMLIDLGMNPKSLLILDGKSISKLQYYAYMPTNTVIKNFISSIIATLRLIQGTAASAGTAEVGYGDSKNTLPLLCFINEKLIKRKNLTNFVIAHEIGHLLRNHTNETRFCERNLKMV